MWCETDERTETGNVDKGLSQKERKRNKGWGGGRTERLWNKRCWARKGRRRTGSEGAGTPKGVKQIANWGKEGHCK